MLIKITKIEPQKNNKKRFSIFSGKRFIAGVSETTLLEFKLHIGSEISTATLKIIDENEKKLSVYNQAFRYLSRRNHSIKELGDKLIHKGFDPDLIQLIIKDLISKNYLDDELFARQLISDEINLKKSGPLLIKKKLIQKGIEFTLIDDLLEQLYDEEKQFENGTIHIARKYSRLHDQNSRDTRIKLGNILRQKGFKWDMSREIISKIIKGEEDEI
jgi:regulatory protein